MGLVLEVTSQHRELLDGDCERSFGSEGGTIGRSLQNDWILPDPDRYISGRHATIDCRSGSWYLVDVSSNGVYVNESMEPLGKGRTRRLFDGDRLRMGDWEFLVRIDDGEDIDVPEPDPIDSIPADFDQRIEAEQQKSGIMLLDEEELTGNEAFQAAVFGSREPPTLMPDESLQAAPAPAAAAETEDDAFETFLEGMGLSSADLHPSIDRRDIMENAGRLFRELVEGMSELLRSRTHVKSMFRLDQTTVLPRRNNPLKLAVNAEDSLKQLLVGKEGEYLSPIDAVREVTRDLRFHQDAVVTAMAAAVKDFVDRLEPDELADHFDRTLPRRALFGSLNRLKYWQMYCDLFPIVTQPGSGPFPQQFGEDFVRYYEREIANRKRDEHRAGSGTMKTRSLDPESRAQPMPLGDTQRFDRSIDDVVAEDEPAGAVDDVEDVAQG